jgi:hypothetical protein
MNKNIFLIAGAGLLLMASCKKQLEEKPFSFLSPSTFYKNATDAQAAINGVFSAMQAQTAYQRTVWLIAELPADHLIGNTTAERAELNTFKWTPSNAEITNWWKTSYLMISRANDVIKYVPDINMDVTTRNHIVGNARFLRALGYFDLVRNFGDVPLLLRPIATATDSLLFPSRTPAADVYKTIIEDLQYAEANCLTNTQIATKGQQGMVSSGAAATLLAKVYLQRAGTTFADAQDNQNALAAVNRVINSKQYQLLPKYADVFDNDKKNGAEHIFSVQFGPVVTGITSNIILRMFFPTQLGGAGAFFVNNTFFSNGYSAADSIRKNYNMANKVGTTSVTPFVYKYRDPSYVSNSNNSNVNWIVLRYSDVLLMQSEAMNNINPADPAKFAGVDTVRSRAGLKDVTQQLNFTNTVTSDAFVDSLVKDRARELFIEGHRRYDLIRLKRYKQAMQAVGITVQDFQYLLPIPQTERDANKNLGQNDGYPK